MFGNLKLSPLVDRACHALCLDDERRMFHPLLWDEVAEAEMVERKAVPKGRITQVWFAGMHSNVGGGYPEDALSLVSLEWIMSEAMASGLKLDPAAVKQISTAKSPYGRLYHSRAGLSAYYGYSPRQVPAPSYQGTEIRPIIHGSVVLRMAYGSDRYAPILLPHRFWVLAPGGELLAMEGFDEKLELDATKTRKAGAGLTSDQTAQASTAAADLQRAMGQIRATRAGCRLPCVGHRVVAADLLFRHGTPHRGIVLRPWLSGFFAEATRASLARISRFGDDLSRTYDDCAWRDRQGLAGRRDYPRGIPRADSSRTISNPGTNAFQEHPAEFVALFLRLSPVFIRAAFWRRESVTGRGLPGTCVRRVTILNG